MDMRKYRIKKEGANYHCVRCKKTYYSYRGRPHLNRLCRPCQLYFHGVKARKLRKSKHLCLDCLKPVIPIKCPHCNKIIKYNNRCSVCLKRKYGENK